MKRNNANTMSVATAPRIAAYQNPMPTRMPIAAVIQIGRSGRQTSDRQAFLEDHARPEEPDAGHDALRHTGRVGPDGVERHFGHPMQLIDGHQHQQGGGEANERVGAKSGRAAVERTLKTDHGADDKGACQPADDDEFIMTHDGILSTCKAYCPN